MNVTMEPTNSTILHNITEHEGEYTTDSCALLKFIWEFGITGAICVLGMIGNSLSLVMFHRLASLSGVMMTLLKVLAWADLSYVTLYSLIQVWPQLVIYIGKGDVIQASLMYGYAYVWPFVSIMMSLSTWYTVLISVHRYIAVSNPLKVSLYSSPAKVKKHIIIVSVIAVVFDIPRFFEINVINIPVPAKNATTKSYVYSDVYKHYIYQLVYKNIIMTVYRKIIPLVIIIACSVRLIIAVHRARKTRERMVNKTNNQVGKEPGPASSSSAGVSMNTEMKVTITMLAIMVTFVVCQLPNAIYPIIRMLMDIDFYNLCDPIWIIIRVADSLVVINSSVNFIIYIASSQVFFREFKSLCWCCFCCCCSSACCTCDFRPCLRKEEKGDNERKEKRSEEIGIFNVAFESDGDVFDTRL